MADVKISALAAKTAATGSEEIPINDAGTTKKITRDNLLKGIGTLDVATLQASTGVKFAGGSDAMDAYALGTVTGVTLTPNTSGTITVDSSVDSLVYTRIGRICHIQGMIQTSAVSSPVGTFVTLGTLPFAAADKTDSAGRCGGAFYVGTSSGKIAAPFIILEGGTTMLIYLDASTIGAAGNGQFYVNATYVVA
jgi:hypothetical protein